MNLLCELTLMTFIWETCGKGALENWAFSKDYNNFFYKKCIKRDKILRYSALRGNTLKNEITGFI